MLKKIPVSTLRVGMYLHELCGSWLQHPFWRSAFLLDDPSDIRRILDSGIREVWIDTAKGLDVPAGETKSDAERKVADRMIEAAERGSPIVEGVPIAAEMKRAARICSSSKQAIVSMFQEARMGRAIDAGHVAPLVEEISASVLRNPGALISLARLKTTDDYTYLHSVAVCALMVALAKQMGLDAEATREAGMAGLLHDIGKIAIPPDILNKPGRLSDAEFAVVRRHPVDGHRMLLEGRGVGDVSLDVCLHHHERMDGSGYPEGLAGERITIFARMGAVCDIYDAITSDRPYKRGWDPAESLRKMAEWSEGHFDASIFHAFVKSVGIYPVGSLVRLQSGRLGVVVEQTPRSLLTPRVRVFFSTRAQAHLPPELIDLSAPGSQDRIVAHEDPQAWDFSTLSDLWIPADT